MRLNQNRSRQSKDRQHFQKRSHHLDRHDHLLLSGMAVPIVHLVPLLTDDGFSLEFATMLMVLMFCGVAGRVLACSDIIGAFQPIFLCLWAKLFRCFVPHLSEPIALYALAAS